MNFEKDMTVIFGEDSSDDGDEEFDSFTSDDLISKRMNQLYQRNEANGVISFHNGTEEAMFIYLEKYARCGDVKDILSKIDDFCWSRAWMMHIGDYKAKVIIGEFEECRKNYSHPDPFVFLEIGSYCGYSTTLLASHMRDKDIFITIEFHPDCVRWTTKLLQFSGLKNRVQIIHGSLDQKETCSQVNNILQQNKFSFVFIDHDKLRYLDDLQILEANNWMRSGCKVVADNVMCLGQPLDAYLTHVRDVNGNYASSRRIDGFVEYSIPPDASNNIVMYEHEVSKVQMNVDKSVKSFSDSIEISVYK